MNSMVEFYQPQADFGTPESKSDATVTLTIDGRDVTVAEGTSVMRAAFEAGIVEAEGGAEATQQLTGRSMAAVELGQSHLPQ